MEIRLMLGDPNPMNRSEANCSKTFSNLCHFVALTRDEKPLTVIDNLVATAVVLEDSVNIPNEKEMAV